MPQPGKADCIRIRGNLIGHIGLLAVSAKVIPPFAFQVTDTEHLLVHKDGPCRMLRANPCSSTYYLYRLVRPGRHAEITPGVNLRMAAQSTLRKHRVQLSKRQGLNRISLIDDHPDSVNEAKMPPRASHNWNLYRICAM